MAPAMNRAIAKIAAAISRSTLIVVLRNIILFFPPARLWVVR
jgi:hypothetical protein